jgi:sialidase-1
MPQRHQLSLSTCVRWFMAALAAISVNRAARPEAPRVTVFESRSDGYRAFRIPAIVLAANGDLLAFAEGRKNGLSDAGNIDIVVKRSTDQGRLWGPLQLVQDEWSDPNSNITIGNPAPVVDRQSLESPGRMWLAFTRNNERVFVTSSDDHGATWSGRREITDTAKKPDWGWYATGPGHGIQLERHGFRGRLLIPCDHRDRENKSWGAHLLYSSDHGATWQIGAVDTRASTGAIHPNENQAAELLDGRIYVNARDQHGTSPATRAIAYSSDGGMSFDAPFMAEPNITTTVVQNSVIRFVAKDEVLEGNFLIYSCPGDSKARRDLMLLVSLDEGRSWTNGMLLHEGPAAYSDLVQLDGRRIGVLYEAGKTLYDRIEFATVVLDELIPISKRP